MLEIGFSPEVARDKIEEELAMELDSAVSGSKNTVLVSGDSHVSHI